MSKIEVLTFECDECHAHTVINVGAGDFLGPVK